MITINTPLKILPNAADKVVKNPLEIFEMKAFEVVSNALIDKLFCKFATTFLAPENASFWKKLTILEFGM